jgi:uncharacterized membrane protein
MTFPVSYDKKQVIQALRYHFITRKEVKVLIILVNVFAIMSAVLYYMNKISATAFFIGSFLWILLMVVFWFLLPNSIYKRAATFRDHFMMTVNDADITLSTERGSRSWEWNQFSTFLESPHFFHLYFDSRSFFLVPKSGIESSDDVHTLRKMLREKIGK